MTVRFYPEHPDSTYASWSASGFHEMRERLAAAVTGDDEAALAPLLDQPDTGGVITLDQATAMLPVLQRVSAEWTTETDDYDAQHLALVCDSIQHAADTGQDVQWTG